MTRMTHATGLAGIFLLIAFAGCGTQKSGGSTEQSSSPATEAGASQAVARADLMAKSDSTLRGTATFKEDSDGEVHFTVKLMDVKPGKHAVHIHETGDCSAEDASSAGGHWNPTHEEHGKWGVKPFHLGDIGNVDVGDDGTGTLSMSTDLWSVGDSSDRDVVGKAIVVHDGTDDFTSQPSGAAGKRIGCGVIRIVSES